MRVQCSISKRNCHVCRHQHCSNHPLHHNFLHHQQKQQVFNQQQNSALFSIISHQPFFSLFLCSLVTMSSAFVAQDRFILLTSTKSGLSLQSLKITQKKSHLLKKKLSEKKSEIRIGKNSRKIREKSTKNWEKNSRKIIRHFWRENSNIQKISQEIHETFSVIFKHFDHQFKVGIQFSIIEKRIKKSLQILCHHKLEL